MPNDQLNPISPYLAQPARNKRKNATQACDTCRRRKRQCDAQRPVCSSCQKAKLECTYNRNGLKRGPKANTTHQGLVISWTTANNRDSSSADITWQHPESSSTPSHFTSMDPFSKEVTDHLVELFFEHIFQDFEFFSPVEFLRQYVRGTINQDLLHAACASAAPLSDHPAIAKTPPSFNGQIYVDRVKTRMIHLISQVSVDVIHTLILLARADYNAGYPQKGLRIEAMATGMALELNLHRLQAPEKPFKSEAERIALEVGIRTLGIAAIHDWIISLVQGLPGMLEHIVVDWPSAGFQQDWWIERVSSTTKGGQQRIESLDDYSVRILHRIHRPCRLKNSDFNIHLMRLTDAGRLVRKFCQGVSSLGYSEDQLSGIEEGNEGADSFATTTKMSALRQQNVQEMYRQAEDALEDWRASLPQEIQPSRAKDMVSTLESYTFVLAEHYYLLIIQLHRPFLLKACMSISNRKKSLAEGAGDFAREDVEGEMKPRVDQSAQQMLKSCLGKCLAAADEISATIELFTDEDIKYRGHVYAFPAFIVGTVYIIQRTVNQSPKKDKLAICRRFLQTTGKYYASAIDQDLLLGRLSSEKVAGVEAEEIRSSSASLSPSVMEVLADIVLPTSSMDAGKIDEFEILWSEGLTTEEVEEWQEMTPLFTPPVAKDLQHQTNCHGVEVEEGADYPVEWRFAPQAIPYSIDSAFSSTTTTLTTTTASITKVTTTPVSAISTPPGKQSKDGSAEGDRVEEMNAFFTTDSGLGTLWRYPEKMASLEEATILSLGKLSMLDQSC